MSTPPRWLAGIWQWSRDPIRNTLAFSERRVEQEILRTRASNSLLSTESIQAFVSARDFIRRAQKTVDAETKHELFRAAKDEASKILSKTKADLRASNNP